jgi:hypothetical protein
VSALAQQTSTPAQLPTNGFTDQELAKSVQNPFEDFVKVPIQSTTGFELDPHHNAGAPAGRSWRRVSRVCVEMGSSEPHPIAIS